MNNINKNTDVIVKALGLSKIYFQANEKITLFNDISFSLKKGETIGLIGSSGSGKTSLLNVIGMLDTPTKGEIIVNDINIAELSENQKVKLRGKNIGFVFQFHNLLPDFTALENVMLAQRINNVEYKIAKEKAIKILNDLKLKERINHYPSQLSGGEQQRVSLARALVNSPLLLIADEPTGSLDTNTAKEVFDILLETVKQYNTTVFLATHDNSLASKMDKQYKISNYSLQELA